jgi:hypothetical protein
MQFTAKKILLYISGIALFLILIMTSSILRGYGQFDVSSLPKAISYVPKYISADIFVDGLTDNLELNYSYGTAVTSMDKILNGELRYQYGMTLLKVLFLPIPRKLFPDKPESIMQQFTRIYNPSYWAAGGSFPVILPCDMFLNFSYLGVLPFAFVWLILNYTFVKFHHISNRNIIYFSYIFLFITVLMFARGSGLELYLLYCIFAMPVFILHLLLKHIIENSRYVIKMPSFTQGIIW